MGDQRKMDGKIPHSVIVRAPGLLPMLYKTSELADDLDVSPRLIRRWIGAGMPHQRDGRSHIWINGRKFAEWIEIQRHTRRGPKLKPGEGYCLRCKQAVQLVNPTRYTGGVSTLLRGACPHCGVTVNRGMRDGESS